MQRDIALLRSARLDVSLLERASDEKERIAVLEKFDAELSARLLACDAEMRRRGLKARPAVLGGRGTVLRAQRAIRLMLCELPGIDPRTSW